jgi:peroxiredoxin
MRFTHTLPRSRAALAVAAMLAMTLPVAARESVQPGKPAPNFSAVDTSGKTVELSAFKGKVVVLEWTNHDCPFVRKHYNSETMQKLQGDASGQGVVWLTVISSAKGQQGYVAGLEADALTAERKAKPAAVLLDADGKVGRLYGASTTPHMFVIDKNGVLAYMGGIDDKPSASQESLKGARPFVREALEALQKGEPVKTASTRPYGCSVKYAEPRS